jgi:UDP-glucuronate decarboxylase
MHPNDGGVVSNFIVQAPRGEPITVYGKVARGAPFCYILSDIVEGFFPD